VLQSIRTLVTDLIDYAGLFPPAKLAMQPAVEAYARAKGGLHEWMLGRFICPASRLEEFSKTAAPLMPGTHATSGYREYAGISEPWRVSVLIDGDLGSALKAIETFNERHANEDSGRAIADAIELKAANPSEIDRFLDGLTEDLFPFVEFPAEVVNTGDVRGYVAALAGLRAGAKIRTGGITAEAFPACGKVAEFIAACDGAGVPFKATAGLHHPIRAEYPLTYDAGAPCGVMHGFLNVFVSAAAVNGDERISAGDLNRCGVGRATEILEDREASNFHFTEEGVRWNTVFVDTTRLAAAREGFALSYGSCSFDEPVEDLRKLGLL
jgi:hypothetical protein